MSAGALCSTLGGYPRNRRSLYGNQNTNPAGSALDASQSDRNNPLDRGSPMPLRRTSWTIEDRMDIFPPGAPRLEEILIDSDAMPWREKSLKGVSEKMLWRNPETGASIALIRFAQGAGIPSPHYHASNQFMICLSGRYEYTRTGIVLTAGSFYCNPKGNVHGPAIAHEETIVVEIYDGPHYAVKPDWYTDEQDAR